MERGNNNEDPTDCYPRASIGLFGQGEGGQGEGVRHLRLFAVVEVNLTDCYLGASIGLFAINAKLLRVYQRLLNFLYKLCGFEGFE